MVENFQDQNLEEDLDLEEIVRAQKAEKNAKEKEKSKDLQTGELGDRIKNLDKRERKFLTVFFVIGLAIIILGSLQFFSNVDLSISEVMRNVPESQKSLSAAQKEQILNGLYEDKDEKLKSLDTDKDGLSDWDEVNIYQTSAYLEDTDSDGFTDKIEIINGQNPLCPEGKDCMITEQRSPYDTDTATASLGGILGQADFSSLDQRLLSGDMEAGELRTFLNDLGAPQDVVNDIDDELLMKLYKQAVATNPVNESGNFDTSILPDQDMQQIENMDADSIRQLLIESGADKELIDGFSDEEIRALYLQTLEELKQ